VSIQGVKMTVEMEAFLPNMNDFKRFGASTRQDEELNESLPFANTKTKKQMGGRQTL